MTRVVVHIDRLVLHGVRAREASSMAEALRGELVRGLERGAARTLAGRGDRSRLALQVPRLAPTADATRVGALVGRRVAQGIRS